MLKNSINLPINSWKGISYQQWLPIHRLTSFIVTEKNDKKTEVSETCKQFMVNSFQLTIFYLSTDNQVH